MTTRFVILGALITLAAGGVQAQPVDVEQTICFFFDEDATLRSYDGSGVIVGYIVANPLWVDGHRAEVLQQWSCTFYWQTAAGVVGNCDVWPRFGMPVEFDATTGLADVNATCVVPLAPSGPTIVAQVGFFLTASEPVSIFIAPGGFQADGGYGEFIHLLSGGGGPMDITEHVANINAPAPIANELRSWGGMKLLYR